jgi:hypothetical protein
MEFISHHSPLYFPSHTDQRQRLKIELCIITPQPRIVQLSLPDCTFVTRINPNIHDCYRTTLTPLMTVSLGRLDLNQISWHLITLEWPQRHEQLQRDTRQFDTKIGHGRLLTVVHPRGHDRSVVHSAHYVEQRSVIMACRSLENMEKIYIYIYIVKIGLQQFS